MAFQPESGLIRWRLHLLSAPAAVFEALATDAGRARFWAESAVETGGVIEFRILNYPPFHGRVLAREAPWRFALEYYGTRVSFTLTDDGRGGTDLALQAEVPDEALRMEMAAGWVSVLLALKAAVDHGVDLRNHDPQRSWVNGYVDN